MLIQRGGHPPQQKPPLGSEVDWGHPLSRGLVGCWLFNEGAGRRVQDCARQNHGLLTNFGGSSTSGWVSSARGEVIRFDGSDDYIDCGHPLGPTTAGDKSIVATICPSAATSGFVVSNRDASASGVTVLYNGEKNIGISWNATNSVVRTPSTMILGAWVTTASVFGPGANGGKIYVSGMLQASGNLGTETPITNKVRIGGRWITPDVGTGATFLGAMDQVSIYSRALTPDEVRWLAAEPYAMIRYAGPRRRYFTVSALDQVFRTRECPPRFRLRELPQRFRMRELPARYAMKECPPRFRLKERGPRFRLRESRP